MSEKIMIQFPDGNKKEFDKGVSLADIASSISSSLRKKVVVGKVNEEMYDLNRPIEADAAIELFDLSSQEGLDVMRHSAAHLTAQAVKRIYKDVHMGVGPVIEDGYYYDFELEHAFSPEDLKAIEKEMHKIVKENLVIEREEISRDEAAKVFADDPLKLELLADIPAGEAVTIYRQGEYVDLCRGPHVPSTSAIKAFALTRVSGAYWRGNSDNQMLQRIYGVAFANEADLKEHLHFVEEAQKRDHRKLGKELELFMFSEEAPGMPFYLPNGQTIRNELEGFMRELQSKYDYQEVRTPFIMNERLWKQSGHWDHYRDNMYFTKVDDQDYALKPMNCPGHALIFKNTRHSYRELPIRMAEFGQVHRHEMSGALNGLLRVRTFCQDDAHIFVRPDQIEDEIKLALKIIDTVYTTLGFPYEVELSTRPEDSMGSDELWESAEASLQRVLDDLGLPYRINEGDGAFYGPKIDFHIKDALKRSHQCGTVQLDFQMPEKFDLNYYDENNEKARPVMLHRAVYGSIDRFLAILIEQFEGAFPAWLAPVQVKVLPVSSRVHGDYALEVQKQLKELGIRCEIDLRDEKVGYKMREAQTKKIPYILVVGDQEVADKAVNVRQYHSDVTEAIAVDKFIEKIQAVIAEKA